MANIIVQCTLCCIIYSVIIHTYVWCRCRKSMSILDIYPPEVVRNFRILAPNPVQNSKSFLYNPLEATQDLISKSISAYKLRPWSRTSVIFNSSILFKFKNHSLKRNFFSSKNQTFSLFGFPTKDFNYLFIRAVACTRVVLWQGFFKL